jgi:hypothetical protein
LGASTARRCGTVLVLLPVSLQTGRNLLSRPGSAASASHLLNPGACGRIDPAL